MAELLEALYHRVWVRVIGDERGQALTEYGLVLVLVAIIAIVALSVIGGWAGSVFNLVGSAF